MDIDALLEQLPPDDGTGALVRLSDLAELVRGAWLDAEEAAPVSSSTTWITTAEARRWWRDAPADDEQLQMLLDLAAEQVTDYGPDSIAAAIVESGIVPNRYRMAQLTQTRNTWNATKIDPANQGIGDEGFVIRPFPLDGTVKYMIRPPQAKPVIA